MSPGRLAVPALLLATVAVSFSAIFIRLAQAPVTVVVWTRMALTVALLLPLFARDARRGRLPAGRRAWALVGLSGMFLAAHFLTWTASLQYTSVASSVLLVSLHPVLVALLGRRLLGEAVSLRLLGGIGLALIGTVITTAGDLRISTDALVGDLLAVAGAVTFTGYLLIGRSVRGGAGAAGYSVPVYALVAAVALVGSPFSGGAVLPGARTLLACLGLAAVCTVLGHTVFNWTLRHVRAAVVSLSFLGEPPITALLAIPLLAERPPGPALVGGVVILGGLALALADRSAAPASELVEIAAAE